MKPLHPKDPRGLVEWVMDAGLVFVTTVGAMMFLAWLYDPGMIR